jgi:NodT family efflux transporter outer membrane factor (OMF) lipoprotein
MERVMKSRERGVESVDVLGGRGAGLAAVIAAAAGLAWLAGCTVGPDYSGAPMQTPEAFASVGAGVGANAAGDSGARATTATAGASLPEGALASWWTTLEDPALTALVARAMEKNLDLRLAEARLRESRALRGVADSARFPQVDATAGASRSRSSETLDGGGFGGGGGGGGGGGSPGDFEPSDGSTNFNVGLDASWEIDVFGRIRREVEAAGADVEAAREARSAAMVLVAADVAEAYVEYRVATRRIDIAERTIRAQRDTVALTQTRLQAGIANELEVAQAQTQLASRQAQLPLLQAAQRLAAYRLGVLLGQAPGDTIAELGTMSTGDGGVASGLAEIPAAMTSVPIGLPSELLRRRPDLREAERRVAAATARIGVATADLYPRFSLTGAFGFSSGDVGNLPQGDSRVWSVGPAMRWSIFNAGRVRATIEAADARTQQALLTYERSVLVALREVEDALTNLAFEQDRQGALARTLASSRRAATLAEDRYKSGVGDFLDALEAQRQSYDAEDQLAASKGASLRALIGVYKSLGGGWPEPVKAAGGAEVEGVAAEATETPKG